MVPRDERLRAAHTTLPTEGHNGPAKFERQHRNSAPHTIHKKAERGGGALRVAVGSLIRSPGR